MLLTWALLCALPVVEALSLAGAVSSSRCYRTGALPFGATHAASRAARAPSLCLQQTAPPEPQERAVGGGRAEVKRGEIASTQLGAAPQPAAANAAMGASVKPTSEEAYFRGVVTVGVVTLLFASQSPAVHAAFSQGTTVPPVQLVNTGVCVSALLGLTFARPLLSAAAPAGSTIDSTADPSGSAAPSADSVSTPESDRLSLTAGGELGLWKFLGTWLQVYGLSLTSAAHGAFLIQLTTFFVPVAQALMGVAIPARIWAAVSLALGGLYLFTQDPSSVDTVSVTGDALCVASAAIFSIYDLRLFYWGSRVPTEALISKKILVQALLAAVILVGSGSASVAYDYVSNADQATLMQLAAVVLWSGVVVNAVAPLLQVGGQQTVGPARAQVIYASQPLWATLMAFIFLGETFGQQGVLGGGLFLAACALAATGPSKDDGEVSNQEVECERAL